MRAIAIGASLGVLLQAPACAKDLVRQDGLYVHRRLGFSLEDPASRAAGWTPLAVEGAELSFAGPGGATMSLVRKCGRPVADLRVLARELLLGIDAAALLAEGPVEVDDGRGWSLTARTEVDGRPVHIKTVTLLLEGCSFDWILVAPGELSASQAVFDRWWASFRAAPAAAPAEESR